ncbi:transposase [Candidatus Methylobacter favarea]|uniref:Transposase n=1 Tax=Candidatus Methylobacter favarea TaxID=2707345 RepID=A0A8S0X903_9GAMM|nr:transposase [Candidatus Methylobacter favarea]
MTNSNVITLNKPERNDPWQEVLREGARKLLAAVVRNGYLPERSIQIGLGDI